MATQPISHAFVLPDKDFEAWLAVIKPYVQAFERVVVVRSPAGNDLNRYRNVTAVEAPVMWYKDDALAHIRRAYPMVVRVDVIPAERPEDLAPIIQQRVRDKDRYGEKQTTPVHIFDRFTLEWPTDARPARITRPFSTKEDNLPDTHEGIDLYAPRGSRVTAGAAGTVATVSIQPTALGYGPYVQIASQLGGSNFIVTYACLQNVAVKTGQQVNVGDLIGESGEYGDKIKIVVQSPPYGIPGFPLPSVVDPTPLIYWQSMRLRPTTDGLRIRSLPSTDGKVLGQINSWEWLESLETHGRTLVKVGVKDQWIRVRMPDGKEGYVAAWFVEARSQTDRIEVFPGVNPVGVNLDIFHPLGAPDPSRIKGLGWVRFGYNVSANAGSEDIDAAYNRYKPAIERYARAGYKVVLTFSHQTYGEGKAEFWPWPEMTDEKWAALTQGFVAMVRRIAAQYAGKDLVHAWQVWNEQDAPIGAVASVPMSPRNYARLLTETIKAIRAVDSKVYIITGGHTAGPGRGGQYARDTIAAMPSSIRPDGIAHHPYGRGTDTSSPYAVFGHIDDEIRAYGPILPDKPLWITEWGVLDRPGDPPDAVSKYATDMTQYLKGRYGGKIATIIWYAWAQGMHNGYGLVSENDQPRQPFYDRFLKA